METFLTFPDRYVDVRGIRTRYWRIGDGKRIVVLLHGHGGSVYEWIFNYPLLMEKYTVVALDLPGHGRTGKPHIEYDYNFFTLFLNDFFEAAGIAKAAVIGHSMGGMIAMHFCTKFPARVEQLILVSPGYGTRFPWFFHIVTVPFLGELSLRPPSSIDDIRKAFRILTYQPFNYDPRCLECYYEYQHAPGYAHAMLSYLRSALNLFGLTRKGREYERWFSGELPKLTQKILLVWGKQDNVIPFSHAARLKKVLPADAQFFELDECGHCPLFEYPVEYNARVELFLEGMGS